MKIENGKLIIDVSDIDQTSYETLAFFGEDYAHTKIGKLVSKWIDETAWDVAAWYIGDDL